MTQAEYIEILFADCGFTPTQRRVWLKAEFGTSDIDALTSSQKHQVIEDFKDRRKPE